MADLWIIKSPTLIIKKFGQQTDPRTSDLRRLIGQSPKLISFYNAK